MVSGKLTVGDYLRDEYVTVDIEASKDEALEKFRKSDFDDRPSLYYIFIEEEGLFRGVASVKDLMNAESLKDAIETDIVSFRPEDDLENAARKIAKYDYQAYPVVRDSILQGVIRLDEVLELVEDEDTDDIFKKAGVVDDKQFYRSEKMLHSSILKEVYARLPWLLFALIGGLVAGGVIEGFQESLQTAVVLAFFIPLIMDMGGNVGTQSSTILVRGLTLDQIHEDNYTGFIMREGLAGLIIGLTVGLLGGAAAFLWQGSIQIAAVITVSMALTCFTAAMIGYLIPLITNRAGRDPAAVSDPMVTTVKDITALLIYFTVAKILLGL